MKNCLRSITITILGIELGVLLASSCNLLGPSVDHFIIRVDQIDAPSSVTPDATLNIRFHGWIGPDGCWSLAAVDLQVTPARLDVTFRGEHKTGSGFECTTLAVALDHEESVTPPLQTPFTITVHQPDGSTLQKIVPGS